MPNYLDPKRYRYSFILLKQLVKSEFKLRYQGSMLGYVWSLLKPTALFAILYLVFSVFLRVGDDIPHFPVYLLLGIVLWSYFLEVTTTSVSSIVGRGDILRKINFPKYVIVLAGSFSALINLLLNLVVVLGFMLVTNVDLRWEGLLFPLLVGELFVFSLAVSFFLSAVFVKFRDISYIWEVILQGAFYATPILYPATLVRDASELGAKILMLNPLAQIIQDSRYVLITEETLRVSDVYGTHLIRAVPILITIFVAVFASWYFRKRSAHFAEDL